MIQACRLQGSRGELRVGWRSGGLVLGPFTKQERTGPAEIYGIFFFFSTLVTFHNTREKVDMEFF